MPKPFLTPASLPEGEQCRTLKIPDDKLWLGIFNSALLELTYYWNYQQVNDTDLTREETAEKCAQIFAQYFDSAGDCVDCHLPGGGRVIRLDEFGNWQMLEGGEWVSANEYYEIPDYTARTEPTSEERICLAALNAAEVLKDTYEAATDAWASTGDPALTAIALALEAATVVGIWINPVVGAAFAIASLVFSVFADTMEFITPDLWTEDFNDAIVCALVEAASDDAGVVTFNFTELLDALAAGTPLEFPSFNDLRLFGQIAYMLQFIGAPALNLAGQATAITVADCPCGEACDYVDDMETMLGDKTCIGDGTVTGCGSLGTYTPGIGRTGGGAVAGVPYAGLSALGFIMVDLGQNCTISYNSMWLYRPGAGGTANFTWWIYDQDGTTLVGSNTLLNISPGWQHFESIGISLTGRYLLYDYEANVDTDLRMDDIAIVAME